MKQKTYQIDDISYLSKPNKVIFYLDDDLSPAESTSTAFMVPLLADGSLVMANNRRRGLEFPGGHINLGETSCAAAHRECFEETGCWVSHIRAVGYLEQTCEGNRPELYSYPWPVSYQQFYVADVMRCTPYVENDECLNPVVISPDAIKDRLDVYKQTIYQAALMTIRKNRLTHS
jgi:8-oxo-dGTP diphosphatase